MELWAGLLLLLLPATPGTWDTYVNQRFGYHIDYPADLLKPQPEAGNNDGRHFTAKHGTADFAAWGNFVMEGATFADSLRFAEADCAGGKATYKLSRPTVWVVSCPLAKGGILYSKGMLKKEAESRFEARYPESEKGTWDAVAARMAGSLSGPDPAY